MFGTLIQLAIIALIVIGSWKVYEKAGQPGWAAIIPIYNIYVLTLIIGRPWWWLLLLFVPIVNIVVIFLMYIDLAKSFGKDTLFGVLMVFFAFVCIPILGFGDAKYGGPAAAAA